MSRESHIWSHNPDNREEINRFLDDLLIKGNDRLEIVQSSSLMNFNSRRWSVLWNKSGEGNEQRPQDREPFAVLIDFTITQGWIDLNMMTEEEGFHQYDIPKKLFDLLEGSKPPNEHAKEWRERCAQAMADTKAKKKLLDTIRKHHEARVPGERPIPVAVGDREATFDRLPYRGKIVDVYTTKYGGHPTLLKPKSLNVPRTLELLKEAGLAA